MHMTPEAIARARAIYAASLTPEQRAAILTPSQGLLELRAFLATYTGPKDKAILAYQQHKNAELRRQAGKAVRP